MTFLRVRRNGVAVMSMLVVLAGATGTIRGQQRAEGLAQIAYTPSSENFPNPERGFYRSVTPFWFGTARIPIDVSAIRAFRGEGVSVIRAYYLIDEFRQAPLSAEALAALAADFAAVRTAGLKIIPRFAYSFPCAGALEPCSPANFGDTDAALPQVLAHIAQLAPVLASNADVIAFVETGFVGAWGEWHNSTHDLVTSPNTVNANSAAIVQALLAALPARRMIALRNPHQKQALVGAAPLSSTQAFNGSPAARIGAHNDCFLASADGGGTYVTPYPPFGNQVELFKQYLSQDNLFVPQGGETCSFEGEAQSYIGCANALADLERTRWSVINLEYQPQVLDLWRQQGCFPVIQQRLGYRFRLVAADVPSAASAGGVLQVRLAVANDGFAAPYNPRGLELVLRHVTTRREHRFPASGDPRFWAPGQTSTVTLNATVSTAVEAGSYEVLLNLPDPEPALNGRPEYSIRLANADVWEPATGYNSLRATVAIGAGESVGNLTLDPPVVVGSTVTLTWRGLNGVLDYLLEAGSATGLANLFNASVGATTSLTANAAAGTYFVRVRGRAAGGLSAASNEVSFTIGGPGPCQGPPTPPTALVGSVNANTAAVSWSPVAGASSYVVQAGPSPGSTTYFDGDVGGVTSVAAAVESGFRAYVRVYAANACGRSGSSTEIVVQ